MSDDFCLGFVLGLVAAGIFGFLAQQGLLLYRRAGAAGRLQRTSMETDRTPAQVVIDSIEAGCLLVAGIVIIAALVWLLIEALA